jgi:hypothetical protein
MSEEIRVPDIPALRVFDPKATRWAVIRGLLRTALTVVAFLFLTWLVLGIGVHLLAHALGRPGQLDRLAVGYRVAHPGFTVHQESARSGGWHQTKTLTGGPVEDATQEVRLRLSMFGVLDVPASRPDPVDEVLLGRAWSKASGERYLARLPSGVTVDGVVVFPSPTTRVALLQDFSQGDDALFYGVAFTPEGGRSRRTAGFLDNPVTWPAVGAHPYQTFADWAAHLSGKDDDNLRSLGLPPSREIKELAKAGQVTAAYVTARTPTELAAMLKDGRIASFTPSAVRFDLTEPQ